MLADPARYTLATGLFRDINKCIRDDNEDGLRRLALPSVFKHKASTSKYQSVEVF